MSSAGEPVFVGVVWREAAERIDDFERVFVDDLAALFTRDDAAAAARSAAARAALLPAGRTAASQGFDVVAERLTQDAGALRERLRLIGDHAEFVLKIGAPIENAASAATGAAYLARRAADARARRALIERALDALGRPISVVTRDGASVLWPRDGVSGFVTALAPLARRLGDAPRLTASGPWPAYSFAEGRLPT